MNDKEIIDILGKVAIAIAQTFGPTCEVAICDLRTKEVAAIENGHVTGRKIGSKIATKVSEYYLNCDSHYHEAILYPSHSIINGRLLRCSSMIISNSDSEAVALFSINIDVESLKEVNECSNSIFTTVPLLSLGDDGTASQDGSGDGAVVSVAEYSKRLMADIIHRVGKPLPLTSKNGRLLILKELEKQGVFLVKDMVPSICHILGISQATLYNYMREIHSENGDESADE